MALPGLPIHIKLHLRTKLLVLFIVISSVPLLLANIVWFNSSRDQILNSTSTSLASTNEDITNQIQDYLHLQEVGLILQSQTNSVLNSDQPKITAELTNFLLQDQDVEDISLLDGNGKEVIRMDRQGVVPADQLTDQSSSAAFRIPTFAGGNEYISPLYTSSSGEPQVDISIPVVRPDSAQSLQSLTTSSIGKARPPGQILGVLKATVRLTSLWDEIVSRRIGVHGYVFIVDDKGDVIAHPNTNLSNSKKNLQGVPEVDKFLVSLQSGSKEQVSVTQANNEFGQLSLTSFAKVTPTNWGVIAEIPLSDTLSQTNQVTRFAGLLFLLFTASVVLMSFWVSDQIVEPVTMLHKGAALIEEGDLNSRLDIKTGDEIEGLADEFNTMAAALQHNISQLTLQNKLLSALRNIDEALLSTVEVKPLSQAIANLITGELGYLLGGIALIDFERRDLSIKAFSKIQGNDTSLIENLIQEKTGVTIEDKKIDLGKSLNLFARVVQRRESTYTDNPADLFIGLLEASQLGSLLPAITEKFPTLRGIYLYPLLSQNRVTGVIFYGLPFAKEAIPPFELTNMENFTNEVSQAMDNALLYQFLDQDRAVISAERNKLSVVLSGIKDAVIAVDLQRNVVIFNKAAESLTGYSVHEVIGKPISSIIKLFNKNEELPDSEYCPIRTDGFEGVIFSKEGLKLIGKNDKERYIQILAGQIKEGVSTNLGCILTFHDMTDEVQLEEMKLDFVSMAAHELRTPLTSIRGYLSVFIEENKDKFTGEQNMFLSRINISAQQLMALIENLLNVTRIERGAFSVNLTPVDWIDMARETVNQFQERAKEKNITLSFQEPAAQIPKINADQLRINEVLSNLISNAISYTPEGGSVAVSIEEQGSEIITHVKDTGEGIPKEAMAHLFTKFFRVAGKLAQGSKGTGLGLYISKAIVEMHKGRIWVDSEVNKGSTFSFALPKA